MPYPVLAIVVSTLAAFAAATVIASSTRRLGFPLPASDGRLGCIDGLRGYLALSVLAHHFVVWIQVTRLGGTWVAPTVPAFNQLGAGAVGLFFMTTGFVFYRRVLTGFRKTSWPAVYLTRAFRILPLLVFSVAVVATVAMARTGELLGRSDLKPLARWVTSWGEPGLAGDPDAGRINAYVLWSLQYEWLFYLFVLPGAAALMDVVRGRVPSWAIPTGLVVLAVAGQSVTSHVPLLHYLPLFAAGMFAFEVRMRPGMATWLQSRIAAVIAAAGLCLAAVTFPMPISPGLPGFVLFFICAASGNSFFGILSTRGALVLGEISFSLYLLHGIVLSLFFVEGGWILDEISSGAAMLFLPLVTAVAVLVSCLTYLSVERPAMRLGSSLASHWTRFRIRSRSAEVEVAP